MRCLNAAPVIPAAPSQPPASWWQTTPPSVLIIGAGLAYIVLASMFDSGRKAWNRRKR